MTKRKILAKKQEALEVFLKKLLGKRERENIAKVLLFGSMIWGESREDSDIDLYIFTKRLKRIEEIAMNISTDVLLETGEIVEPMIKTLKDYYSPRSGLLIKAIREGEELYSNEKLL